LVILVIQVHLDLRAYLERPDSLVVQEIPDLPDLSVVRDSLVRLELMVRTEVPATAARQVLPVLREQQVTKDRKDQLVLSARLVRLEHLEILGLLVLQVSRVRKETRALRGSRALQGHQAQAGRWVESVHLAPLDSTVSQDLKDLRVLRVHQAHPASPEHLERLETPDQVVRLETPELQAPQGSLEQVDRLEHLARRVLRAIRGHQVQMELQGPRVQLAHQVIRVLVDFPEMPVSPDRLVPVVHPEQMECRE